MAIARVVVVPLFAVMAIVQLVRFLQAWPVSINGFAVPVWASAVAAVAFATLAILLWREGRPR